MKDLMIVFTPKLKSYPNPRFLISINRLDYYIGSENANKVLLKAENMKTNKVTLKFRKYGKIEIYLK